MRVNSRMVVHKTKKVVDNTNKVEDKIAEVDGHKKNYQVCGGGDPGSGWHLDGLVDVS